MKISNFDLAGDKVFIIAEIGNNHNGDIDRAITMIDEAISIGVDCVKFQMRNMASVYRKRSLAKDGEDLGTEYILDLLKLFELSKFEHAKVAEYCSEKVFCTCVRHGIVIVSRFWKVLMCQLIK